MIYFLAKIEIHDPEEYDLYLRNSGEIFSKYRGRYLAVDKDPEVIEGPYDGSRIVLIEFDTREDFENWYFSVDYQQILAHRLNAATCHSVLVRGQI